MAAVWEREPDETVKAYNAFCIYRDLPPNERSLAKVAEVLGVTVNTLAVWSSPKKYRWVTRALDYDEYKRNRTITVKQATSQEGKQAIMAQEGIENAALTYIAEQAISVFKNGDPAQYDMLAITRLLNIVERVQNMRRRNVGLPVTYTSKMVDEEPNESPIFYAQPEVIERGRNEEETDQNLLSE